MAIGIEKLRQADLNLLVYFVVLVEERSVSRAASRLLLTQPALSRALQRLRDLFNDELLVRGPKGYQTTPRGEELLSQLAVVLPQLNTMIAGAGFDPARDETAFNISAPDSMTQIYGSLLAPKHASMSCVTFTFWQFSEDRYDALESNSRDLVIDADYLIPTEELQSEVLTDEELVCLVDKDSPLPDRLTMEQYLKLDHISINLLRGRQPTPGDLFTKLGVKRHCAFVVPYFSAAIRMVAGTTLVATVGRCVAEALRDKEATRVVDAPEEFKRYQFRMIWHKRYDNDPRHMWLRQTFRETAKEYREWISL